MTATAATTIRRGHQRAILLVDRLAGLLSAGSTSSTRPVVDLRRPDRSSPARSSARRPQRARQSSPWTKTKPSGRAARGRRRPGRRARSGPVSTGRAAPGRPSTATNAISPASVPAIASTTRQRDLVRARRPGRTAAARRRRSTTAPGERERAVARRRTARRRRSAAASSISSSPAALIGRTWSPKRPRISEIAPTVPGKIRPGFQSSTTMPERAERQQQRRSCSGRSACRGCACQSDISTFVDLRVRRCAGRCPSAPSCVPSIWFSSAGRVGAIDVDHVLLAAPRVAARFERLAHGLRRPSRRSGRASRRARAATRPRR